VGRLTVYETHMATREFAGVTVAAKANVYFDGRVVSHALTFPDGAKKTLGLVYPGEYHFATSAPEGMEITAGSCEVRLDGTTVWRTYETGSRFDVPGESGFTIRVRRGIAEYVCSFG
jgi:hypothetical protein